MSNVQCNDLNFVQALYELLDSVNLRERGSTPGLQVNLTQHQFAPNIRLHSLGANSDSSFETVQESARKPVNITFQGRFVLFHQAADTGEYRKKRLRSTLSHWHKSTTRKGLAISDRLKTGRPAQQ